MSDKLNSPSSTFKNNNTSSFQLNNTNKIITNNNNIDNNRIPPIKKLTVLLIKTYREKYYEKKAKRQAEEAIRNANLGPGRGGKQNQGWDDEHYDLLIQPNDIIYDHFRITAILGKGSFGVVAKAEDLRHPEGNEWVAIKIIKSKRPFFEQARTEIAVLTLLNERDPLDERGIVRMLEHFVYKNHQCIVFQLLSYNLYDLIKDTRFHGVSLNHIRRFAKQIFDTLDFLLPPTASGLKVPIAPANTPQPNIYDSSVGVIHCDLKPENILLRYPKRSAIKMIDFGSSCFTNERMYSYIQSRFYRAPEILVGLPYTHSIDMWSVGCILVELHTGEPIFSGSDEIDQIYHHVAVLGMPPNWMLDAGKKSKNGFRKQLSSNVDSLGNVTERVEWTLRDRKNAAGQVIAMPRHRTIRGILGVETGGPHSKSYTDNPPEGHSIVDYLRFEDLIKKLLDWNPDTRLTPAEALLHPFFKSSQEISTSTVDLVNTIEISSLPSKSPSASPIDTFLTSITNWYSLPQVYQQQLTQIGYRIINSQSVDPLLIHALPLEHKLIIEKFQQKFKYNQHTTDNGMDIEVENSHLHHDVSQQCNLDKNNSNIREIRSR